MKFWMYIIQNQGNGHIEMKMNQHNNVKHTM